MANPSIPPTQYFYTTGPQVGFDLTNYLVVNGGGNVYQVRSAGSLSGERPGLQGRLYSSIQSAGAQCRANSGDVVLCLEGHVETVTGANWLSGLPAGVTIIGQGFGTSQARMDFTAAGSNLGSSGGNLALANTVIAGFNMNLNATAATIVTAPVTVTAADCALIGNRMTFSTSATQQATIPVTLPAGANRFIFARNTFYASDGTFATNPTQGVLVSGAISGLYFGYNKCVMACNTTGAGVLQFTAAATDSLIEWNSFTQNKAASTVGLVGFAGVTGIVRYNDVAIQAATGGATAIGTIGSWVMNQNFGVALGGAGHTGVSIGTGSS